MGGWNGLKVLMRSRCWSPKGRIATSLFTDWLHSPAWGVFSSQRYCSHLLLGIYAIVADDGISKTLWRKKRPWPKVSGAKLSKNTKFPPPKKKWRAQVFILKPLSTTFQIKLAIIIFNRWHQGHPVWASSHWIQVSNLVILFFLFNGVRWWF